MTTQNEDQIIVDLARCTDGGRVHNLAGRPLGRNARDEYRLDDLDGAEDPVTVRVPDHVYGISPSFFLAMFSASIERLGGREGFLKRYHFDCDDVIMKQVENGIEDWSARGVVTARSEAQAVPA